MTDSSTREVGHSTFTRDGITAEYKGSRETVSFDEGKGADTATGVLAADLEGTVEDV